MTHQVNTAGSPSDGDRGRSLMAAAVTLPVIAAFVGLQVPRAAPLPRDVPRAQVTGRQRAAVEERDLAATAKLRDSAALRLADQRFGEWNEAESVLADSTAARAAFRSALGALPPDERMSFLAARATAFLVTIQRVRAAVAAGREDRAALNRMRALVGRAFEERAVGNGLIDADDLVLRAAFKLRVLTAVDPAAIARVSSPERIAFHDFVASEAKHQEIAVRLRSVEEIGRLDRAYPVDLAAAILLAAAGDRAAAFERLLQCRTPTVRTRNHLLWLSSRAGAKT